jgi:hypothetical protein
VSAVRVVNGGGDGDDVVAVVEGLKTKAVLEVFV